MKSLVDTFSWAKVTAILVLLAALVWASTRLDWSLIGQHLSSADLSLVVAMAVTWSFAMLIRPVRLLLIIRAAIPIAWRHYWLVWAADIIALVANSIAPMRAGDLLIPFLLRRAIGARVSQLLPMVIVDRFFDFTTVVLIFVLSLTAVPIAVPWAANVILALLIGLAMLVAAFWISITKREVWIARLDQLNAHFGKKSGEGLIGMIQGLLLNFGRIGRLQVVVPAFALSLALWITTIAAYWLGACSIYHQTSFVGVAFAGAAVALSFVVPLTPGGVGIFHAAMTLALTLFGVPAETALAISIIIHAVLLGTAFSLAGVAMIVQRVSVHSLVHIEEKSASP